MCSRVPLPSQMGDPNTSGRSSDLPTAVQCRAPSLDRLHATRTVSSPSMRSTRTPPQNFAPVTCCLLVTKEDVKYVDRCASRDASRLQELRGVCSGDLQTSSRRGRFHLRVNITLLGHLGSWRYSIRSSSSPPVESRITVRTSTRYLYQDRIRPSHTRGTH